MENEQAKETVAPQSEISIETDVKTAPLESSPVISPEQGVKNAQTMDKKTEPAIPYERFSELKRQRDTFNNELKKAQEQNQKLVEMLNSMNQKKPNDLTLEQQQAAQQLEEILLGQPKFKSLMDKLAQLESRNSQFSESQTESAFDKEEESLSKWAESKGLNLEELKPELQSWLDEHPYFSKVDIQPGFYTIAAKAIYADKAQEYAERAANLKLIKEQEAKKKANTQAPGQTAAKESPKEKFEDFVARRGEELGVFGKS